MAAKGYLLQFPAAPVLVDNTKHCVGLIIYFLAYLSNLKQGSIITPTADIWPQKSNNWFQIFS